MSFCEYCQMFKNTYFEEHLPIAASKARILFPKYFKFHWKRKKRQKEYSLTSGGFMLEWKPVQKEQ